jgi:hypothetical protein
MAVKTTATTRATGGSGDRRQTQRAAIGARGAPRTVKPERPTGIATQGATNGAGLWESRPIHH